jgi:hypothetical protein
MFQAPEFKLDRDSVTLYRTPFPQRTEAAVGKLAERFGVKGKTQDLGARLVIKDRRSSLEVFVASNSVRWSMLQNGRSESPNGRVALPEEGAAREQADAFLKQHKLGVESAEFDSVTQSVLSRVQRRRKKAIETIPVAAHVNYRFALDGVPLLGPGAKIQVTFGNRGKIVECYRFWRTPKAERELPLLPPDAAISLLREDPMLADLNLREARVVYHRGRLGYYALPPREAQGCLIPVYAFDGTISTPALERYDFVRYVVGVRFTPEDAKQVGAAFRGSGPLFS